jgi:hypothetical protein
MGNKEIQKTISKLKSLYLNGRRRRKLKEIGFEPREEIREDVQEGRVENCNEET